MRRRASQQRRRASLCIKPGTSSCLGQVGEVVMRDNRVLFVERTLTILLFSIILFAIGVLFSLSRRVAPNFDPYQFLAFLSLGIGSMGLFFIYLLRHGFIAKILSDEDNFRSKMTTQEAVDSHLSLLAESLHVVWGKEADLRQKASKRKRPDPELDGVIRDFSAAARKQKADFWAFHGLANRLGYSVRVSYHDYLEEEVEIPR